MKKRMKYRPSRKEQGLYTVRLIGEELPTSSPDQAEREREAARSWGMVSSVTTNPAGHYVQGLTGLQKRNFRGSDIGRKSKKEL